MNLTIEILVTDAKNEKKNQTRSQLFYDGRKFWRQCAMTFKTKQDGSIIAHSLQESSSSQLGLVHMSAGLARD